VKNSINELSTENSFSNEIRSYADSPAVKKTVESFYRTEYPLNHTTSVISNWKAVLALDSPS
jgi:hypothetical protein